MDKDSIKRLADNPDFIPGIYNYCDRWCERCPFTSRCMNYALNEEQFSESGAQDMFNKLFWEKLAETFRVTRELLEETLEKHGIDINELDLEAAAREEEIRRENVKQHECSRIAKEYDEMATEWFEVSEDTIRQKRDDVIYEYAELGLPEDATIKQFAQFGDALEIILWYQKQIYVKILRALSGRFYEDNWEEEDDDYPKDSDGSAKVALIGIDRSITAWMALRTYLPEYKDELIDVLVHLDRLRKKVEAYFPNARAFIRPGFDEIPDDPPF